MTNLSKKLKTLVKAQVDQDGVERDQDLLPQRKVVEDQRDLEVLEPAENYFLRQPVLAMKESQMRARKKQKVSHKRAEPLDEAEMDRKYEDEDVKGVIGQYVLAYDKQMYAQKKKSLFLGRITEIDEEGIETVHVYKGKTKDKKHYVLPYWITTLRLQTEI
jgi:hypothetical protein